MSRRSMAASTVSRSIKRAALLGCALLLPACGGGDDAPPPPEPELRFTEIFAAIDFQQPFFVTHAPGDTDRVYVTTKAGLIHVIDNDPAATTSKIFFDMRDRVTDQTGDVGLLGLAFDPEFQANRQFYVHYIPNFGGRGGGNFRRSTVSRFVTLPTDPDAGDLNSEVILMTWRQPYGNLNKGGWIGFGPGDGKLYIASGDGAAANDPDNNAQNVASALGKILRIERDGRFPVDNPFNDVSSPEARGAVWALGLRNPYRASFDRLTGELWAGDQGQTRQEVDKIVRAGNYGWRKFEGTQVFNETDPDPGNTVPPQFEYANEEDGLCEIIGGYVYRGTALGPEFDGTYFFVDRCTRDLFGLRGGVATVYARFPGSPLSFGEDADGELYVTSNANIYRITRGND